MNAEMRAKTERQNRVAKAVWGLLFIGLGAAFARADLLNVDTGKPELAAPHAVDGNKDTRWSSAFRDPQWITVDLLASAEITRVRLLWENAHATAYQIQVSNDNASWKTVVEVTDGNGGEDDHPVATSGRYVRMNGIRRSTPWGYSLWEFEVYGSNGATPGVLLSLNKPVRASGTEGPPYWAFYWARYWPWFLIAAGLPALIVPKNSGDQVFGLSLTMVGVFFQLRSLQIITWSYSTIWPLVLVVAGLLLVTQAWRPAEKRSGCANPHVPPTAGGE
jgi:hypothetical protein